MIEKLGITNKRGFVMIKKKREIKLKAKYVFFFGGGHLFLLVLMQSNLRFTHFAIGSPLQTQREERLRQRVGL